MSLKILKIDGRVARVGLIAAALVAVTLSWFFAKWNFANMVATRLDTKAIKPETKLISDWLTGVAPSDPQTHFTAAVIYEKTFDMGDLDRSLKEYEAATEMSPNNYFMWANLGRVRSDSGDTDGAEAAFQRAMALAPNYSYVQWSYGNFLVRQGKPDAGFALIAKAAAGNPEYSRPAVQTALQILNSDINAVRRSLGDTDATNSALVQTLLSLKHYEDAVDAWSRIGAAEKAEKFKKLGEDMTRELIQAKKYELAVRVASDLQPNAADKPVAGQIFNGGFESGVKLRDAGPFDWQIADGGEPQIGLNENQKRSGKYGLFLSFNSNDPAAFRGVSETVAVAPGASYELEIYYKSDLKTAVKIKWEVVEMESNTVITSTQPLAAVNDFTSSKTVFKVPANTDGIIIRLAREGCIGVSCPINGKLAFDDISLRRL